MARGIETWAIDTAAAVSACLRDPAARLPGRLPHAVTLFCGGCLSSPPDCRVEVLGCLRRGDEAARRLAARSPGVAWRWGLTNPYGWEQGSFWWRLWPRLRQGGFDVLHVQDPMLAYWCRAFRTAGLVRTREILAHGTEEPASFVRKFRYVQHLAPWHLEQFAGSPDRGPGDWAAIPNFVDCATFAPPDAAGRAAARSRLGIPADAFVVGCVAAVKKDHKRVDHLIRETARAEGRSGSAGGDGVEPRRFLLIAGARTPDSGELADLAERLVPGRFALRLDCPRAEMPGLYAAMDVLVLASLFEMMPIAVLEGLACGLPVATHDHPVMTWMTGAHEEHAGGWAVDMGQNGGLSGFLTDLRPPDAAERGRNARARAVRMFSKEAVAGQYVAYYRRVIEGG